MCDRKHIRVERKPITVFSDRGMTIGNWYAFPKPEGDRPPDFGRLTNSQRVLWCPYCDAWTIFDKRENDISDEHKCTGVCGWASTGDYYVKTYNSLWYENYTPKKQK